MLLSLEADFFKDARLEMQIPKPVYILLNRLPFIEMQTTPLCEDVVLSMVSQKLIHDRLSTSFPRLWRRLSHPKAGPPFLARFEQVHGDMAELRAFIKVFTAKSGIKLLDER